MHQLTATAAGLVVQGLRAHRHGPWYRADGEHQHVVGQLVPAGVRTCASRHVDGDDAVVTQLGAGRSGKASQGHADQATNGQGIAHTDRTVVR